ncbi:MAG: transketolase [Spiroplasma poulsonii]|uniref:Transketolase n=1 Tax=Spiroplasma poulsonii TaxID=2138 RepID=A0A2P6FCQ0_9MOLU|nr:MULTISPECIES: transketolase [Spiroplasma]KAF0851629.1 Transketolase [Spiroplasma poulsonii]MBH8623123.1 transketolase [Spiroplasma sp. hyd1]MBW1242462.1 transketolase [Spiroplasma poulsonii]PQM31227.1 Transketolase [Spiroplasma poulsonii]PWF96230.1 Transketolase [Spiroplasma poulsonii]
MKDTNNNIETKSLSNLRILGLDPIIYNKTGHPGIVLSAAPMMQAIYLNNLIANPAVPDWINRDRFVLSPGHASTLQYAILHFAGYDLSIDDLKNYRHINSKTPAHPEYGVTPGVDNSSGPLGQGVGYGVGMALAEQHLAAKFNKSGHDIIDHYTYVLCSDGDLQEGGALEAIQLAGVWKLNKLIMLYDSNDCQLDTKCDEVLKVNYQKFFEAQNWNYIRVDNADEDLTAIKKAITAAQKSDKPTLIECKTIIGYGHPKQGSPMHSSPFTAEEMQQVQTFYDFEHPQFYVDPDVKTYWKDAFIKRGQETYQTWAKKLKAYQTAFPEEFKQLFAAPTVEFDAFKSFLTTDQNKKAGTRIIMGDVFKYYQQKCPNNMFGGSADLGTATKIIGYNGSWTIKTPQNNNIHFGVREFAAGTISIGIELHQGLKGFNSTFLIFSDYMKPCIRMACIQNLPVIFAFSHDSIGVGFDGKSHQPVEQLAMLRNCPNLNVLRPADINEAIGCLKLVVETKKTPSALILSRQDTPYQLATTCYKKTLQGGYIVVEEDKTKPLTAIIIATGTEVPIAINAAKTMKANIRVVSMPSVELFDQQPIAYQESVIPKDFPKVIAIEFSNDYVWYKFVGKTGLVIGVDDYGLSGSADAVIKYKCLDQDTIIQRIEKYLG